MANLAEQFIEEFIKETKIGNVVYGDEKINKQECLLVLFPIYYYLKEEFSYSYKKTAAIFNKEASMARYGAIRYQYYLNEYSEEFLVHNDLALRLIAKIKSQIKL